MGIIDSMMTSYRTVNSYEQYCFLEFTGFVCIGRRGSPWGAAADGLFF